MKQPRMRSTYFRLRRSNSPLRRFYAWRLGRALEEAPAEVLRKLEADVAARPEWDGLDVAAALWGLLRGSEAQISILFPDLFPEASPPPAHSPAPTLPADLVPPPDPQSDLGTPALAWAMGAAREALERISRIYHGHVVLLESFRRREQPELAGFAWSAWRLLEDLAASGEEWWKREGRGGLRALADLLRERLAARGDPGDPEALAVAAFRRIGLQEEAARWLARQDRYGQAVAWIAGHAVAVLARAARGGPDPWALWLPAILEVMLEDVQAALASRAAPGTALAHRLETAREVLAALAARED